MFLMQIQAYYYYRYAIIRNTIRQYPYAQYRHIFIHIDWNFSRFYAFLKHEYKIQLPGLNWNILYIFCSGSLTQKGLDLVGFIVLTGTLQSFRKSSAVSFVFFK